MSKPQSWLLQCSAFIASAAFGLFAASLLLLVTGTPVYRTYSALFRGSVGSLAAVEGSLVYAVPIAFTALAASVAFRARVWNIGAEGQMVMGAFGAAAVALHLPLPGSLMLIALVVSGMICGAVWGLIPGALKAGLGVNEVLSTLMLNYVAILWIDFLVYGPWRDPAGGWPYSPPFPATALLPGIGSELNISLIAVPIVAAALFVLFRYSRWGFALSVAGNSPPAARYAGIRIGPITVQVMLVSGAVAALAGIEQVSGTAGVLYHLPAGYGYLGILVSWLAGHNPLVILPISVFYGMLLQAGTALQIAQVDPSLVRVLQAFIILFALAGLTLARRRSQMLGVPA